MSGREESAQLLEFFTLAFMRPTEEWVKEIESLLEKVRERWPQSDLRVEDPHLMNQEYVRLFRFGKDIPSPLRIGI